MSISSVAPAAATGAAALTDAGIGSGLDVNSIVSQLMLVQSQPLTQLNNQVASYQATLSAYGTVNSALSTFQSAVQSLNSPSMYDSLSVTPSSSSVLTGSATSTAVTGSYNVDVTQLAQAQSLTTAGQPSTSSAISGGFFAGTALGSSVATNGIAAGSLTINGTPIATSSSTTSAVALVAQITAADVTGLTATAQASSSGTLGAFTPVITGTSDAYTLQVGSTTVENIGQNSGLTVTQLDIDLGNDRATLLSADGISFTGTAAAGTLQFTNADGSNLAISQTLTNTSLSATGGVTGLGPSGSTQTYLGSVNLTSANPISVAGSAPSAAGLGSNLGSSISFQFGAISADWVGNPLDLSVATNGITAGTLTINGTTIVTSSGTTSNTLLEQQINLATGTTGVTAAVSGSGITLTSANPITVAGSSASLAGFTAGTTLANGSYNNSTFTQNTSISGGAVGINSSNNSLQGIASAINSANLGVTATIINDGSGKPYRLALTSNATGAASSMKISVSGDPALSSLLANDPAGTQSMTQSVNAQNTALTINGIPITSASNTISSAIQGVTLNVSQTGTTSVAVAQNSSSVQSAVSALVTAYNTLNTTFSQATAYNATTLTAGPLIGDSGIAAIQAQMRQLLDMPIAGANQNLNSIAQLGMTFQSDGSLALNTGTLQTALTSNFSNVGALFSAIGATSDSLIGFNTSTAATQPGTYALNITQLATQGTQVGSAAPALTITSGSNDQLSLLIDGINASVTLAAGVYTPTSLAAEVQTAINGSTAIANAGSAVNVAVNASGALSFTSQRYGSASMVSLGGDAALPLFGSSSLPLLTIPTPSNGVDVAGTIGGNPAVGSGQVLTASAGSPTAGMALTVNGGATGARGTINFSQGYAYQLNSQLTSFLGSAGPLITEGDALTNSITSIQTQIATLNKTLAAEQANYMTEFTALDSTMASLDATQTFLTQQLAAMTSSNGG